MSLRNTAVAVLFLSLGAGEVTAQVDTERWLDECREHRWSQQESFCEVRSFELPAGLESLRVNAAPNGGITVEGWDRDDIGVWARIRASGDTEAEARANAARIEISTDGGYVRSTGPRQRRGEGWTVSYEVRVPRRMNLDLRSVNGGLAVRSVSGNFDLHTTNGGLSLTDVNGDVRGETTNGGISVHLAGDRWTGAGMWLHTTNGGVTLRVPDGFSANLEASTVHGGIDTDFPIDLPRRRWGPRRVEAQLGNGGPRVEINTVNGGISIRRR